MGVRFLTLSSVNRATHKVAISGDNDPGDTPDAATQLSSSRAGKGLTGLLSQPPSRNRFVFSLPYFFVSLADFFAACFEGALVAAYVACMSRGFSGSLWEPLKVLGNFFDTRDMKKAGSGPAIFDISV
jgi:hypothetical protein